MTDFGASLIAKALRFVGLCLFYGMLAKRATNMQDAVDIIKSEYAKQ